MRISIIIPIYNGEKYLKNLIKSLRAQSSVMEVEIIAAVSRSKDNSLSLAKELCDVVFEVNNFNHGRTRHEAALLSKGEYLVFITQDILPFDETWLTNLIEPLTKNNTIVATYSRQTAYPNATSTESYIREFNYPKNDRLCNDSTIKKWGRKNIFYSDASSATKRDVFFQLGGYNFDVITNEDVTYALNVIESGKSILYNSKSVVYHSHNFSLKENIARYKLIGKYEKLFQDRLSQYSSSGEGIKLLKFVATKLFKEIKFKELFIFLFLDIPSRLIAYKVGYNQKLEQE
ncbi:glycosyltransferase family 2 protein [Gottfriedia acidiceleris]|uniref:glycosyltransferase family 2 protein n=1 Tax=Gottfriedia acidiceleris TaxID=371036 RepID=UPI003D2086F4